MNAFLKKVEILKKAVLLVLLFCSPVYPAEGEPTDVTDAVVKIYTVYNRFNYSIPWQMKGQRSQSGSGCIIKGKRILTSAHVVSDQTFIQVRRSGQTKKYTATVETIAQDCDLAILKVEDPTFFSGTTPITLGELPKIRDKVYVCGFPAGGDKLSVTEGVVSRIEHSSYVQSTAFLLTCQIDAAINAGNSGGPVIKGNRLVGVAFQAAKSLENVGYMVPTPVIRQFFKDMEEGRYDGIPTLGIFCQKMENQDIRDYYGMSEKQSGVLVDKVYMGSPVSGYIKPGDAILTVDGYAVGVDGTIEFMKGYRTFFEYPIQCRQINDLVDIRILRNKKVSKVRCTLSKRVNFWRLVPPEQHDVSPTYYIVGGLVFEPLTVNYLKEWGSNWPDNAPMDLVRSYLRGEKSAKRKEVVVLVNVLADEINSGYQDQANEIINNVNGRAISSMTDLVKAFEENKNNYHIIKEEKSYHIILEKNKVDHFGPRILERYMIRSDRSSDLQAPNIKIKEGGKDYGKLQK